MTATGRRRRSGKGERAMVPPAEFRSYYGQPIVKRPVWKWQIPAYFFSGGLAAGSSALALGGSITGRRKLARRSKLVALAGIATSTAFLIDDLGRPGRFANMLRVAKPTSPMSVGSWVLAMYGPAVGAAALGDVTGVLPAVGALATVSAAALSPVVATYTAVLVSDTAIPVWHEARGHLPFLFAAGACASAGGVAAAVTPVAQAGPARRLALAGAAAELVAARAMEESLGEVGRVYQQGWAGRHSRLSARLTAAGAGVLVVAGRRRTGAVVGGLLVAAGAALERFAVAEAGHQSAADPTAVVRTQRR
jgi:formate-dependent nitrite reductase membrane component NrfD